jgi:hypothetical protein
MPRAPPFSAAWQSTNSVETISRVMNSFSAFVSPRARIAPPESSELHSRNLDDLMKIVVFIDWDRP